VSRPQRHAGDGAATSSREAQPLVGARTLQRAAALLSAASVVLLLAGAGRWLVQRPWFDLRQVELHAADGGELRHVSADTVRAATQGRLAGNFFTMSLDQARRVFESVPWVAAVSVRRAWPDRLIVTLTEHRAVAVWDDGRLLADSGKLFVANVAEAELDGTLPQVDAPARLSAEVARRLPQLTQWARSIGLAVHAVEVSERASWTLRSDGGPVIELGRDEPAGRLDERLALLLRHYPAIAAQLGGEPVRIDARYPAGFAVAAPARKKP
jgi:cell division protein FtsQ